MRGICACAMVGTLLAVPPGVKADETATAAAVKPQPIVVEAGAPAPRPPAVQPLFLKTTRIYLDRRLPVDAKNGAAPPLELDLEMKPADLKWLMTQVSYNPDDQESGTVEVVGKLDTSGPDVPGGFGALFWAVKNPLQAWRIFTPVE